MCPSLRLLNQTKNGCFTFCNTSKLFQITFNNLCFEFYEWELENFKDHLSVLMKQDWASSSVNPLFSKEIPISVGNKFFIILVSKEELFELHSLMNAASQKVSIIRAKDIDYRFIEN